MNEVLHPSDTIRQPHTHKGMALIAWLCAQAQASPPPLPLQKYVRALQHLLTTTEQFDIGQMDDIISTCRVKSMVDKPGKSSTVRLTFTADTVIELPKQGELPEREVDLQQAVYALLQHNRIQKTNGPPGPSMTEKRVSNNLSKRLGQEPRYK